MAQANVYPKRLNLGCGFDVRSGWLNVDGESFHSPDLTADITHLPMLPSGYFDEVLAQDVLEHISRPLQTVALSEWRRLLSKDGVLRIRVPSLIDMVFLGTRKEWKSLERQQYLIQMVYGTQAYPGDYHRCGYTPATLTFSAAEASLIVTDAYLKDEWLYDVQLRHADMLPDLTSREFIEHIYFSYGHRIADEGGCAYWSEQIERGVSRSMVKERIISGLSTEND